MELEDLLLKREEVPIGLPFGPIIKEFDNQWCMIPIHHSLKDSLPDDLKYDMSLALGVMNDAIDWYEEDLRRYHKGLADEGVKGWVERIFLNDLPVKRDVWKWPMGLGRGMRVDMVVSQDFLYSLGLTTDCHIYADTGAFDGTGMDNGKVNLSKEKFVEYSIDGDVRDWDGFYCCDMYAWQQHNVDTIPQAIMLRDWAILYENVLLRKMDELGRLEYRLE